MPELKKFLYVSKDQPSFAKDLPRVQEVLQGECELTCVHSGDEAIRILGQGLTNVLFMDDLIVRRAEPFDPRLSQELTSTDYKDYRSLARACGEGIKWYTPGLRLIQYAGKLPQVKTAVITGFQTDKYRESELNNAAWTLGADIVFAPLYKPSEIIEKNKWKLIREDVRTS